MNVIQEGFASFLNFTTIQMPVSASACHIQHNTRRLCWPLLLAIPFYSVLESVYVFMAFSTVFHSIHSPDNSPLSHSVLSVTFLPYWSFNYISLYESLPQPLYSPLWLTGLKAPTTHCVRPLGWKKNNRIKHILNLLYCAVFETLCFRFDTRSTILP